MSFTVQISTQCINVIETGLYLDRSDDKSLTLRVVAGSSIDLSCFRRRDGQSLLFDYRTMSVYRALEATRFLPNLAGASPYSLSGSRIKFSRIGFVWPFIQLLGLACHLYFNITDIPIKAKSVKSLLLGASSWLQCFIAVYGSLKDGLLQKDIIDIVRSIDTYDKRSGYANDNIRKRENERVRVWSYVYSTVIVVFAIVRYLTWRNIRYLIVVEIWTVQIDNGIYMVIVVIIVVVLSFFFVHDIIIVL